MWKYLISWCIIVHSIKNDSIVMAEQCHTREFKTKDSANRFFYNVVPQIQDLSKASFDSLKVVK